MAGTINDTRETINDKELMFGILDHAIKCLLPRDYGLGIKTVELTLAHSRGWGPCVVRVDVTYRQDRYAYPPATDDLPIAIATFERDREL